MLQPVRAVRVSGTVVDSNGAPTQAMLNLTPAGFGDEGGLQMGNPARVLPDGTFTILNVVPGEYVLTVNGRANGNATPEVASMPLTVGNDDLAGVSIATSKGGTIRGTIVADNNAKVATTNIQVSVQPLRPTPGSFQPRAQVSSAGTFELNGLIGAQVLRVDRLPDGWIVKSIRANGRDITDTALEFRGSEAGDRSSRADQSHQRGEWRGQGQRATGHVGKRRALSGGCRAVGVPVAARAHGARRSNRRLPRAIAAAG